MKPYYEHGGITIYHGDCRDILPLIADAALTLTDPPYGLGDRWQGGTWGAAEMYKDARQWDQEPIDPETMRLVLSKAPRSIVWGGNYYPMPASRCWLAWVKTSRMDTMADMELAWTNLDRPAKLMEEDRNPDGRRQHPTQKPESLMRWCIKLAGGEGLVLDPFMGIGTTLRAAKDAKRKAIGIDLSERYCEIAAKRLSQEVLPLGLSSDLDLP